MAAAEKLVVPHHLSAALIAAQGLVRVCFFYNPFNPVHGSVGELAHGVFHGPRDSEF